MTIGTLMLCDLCYHGYETTSHRISGFLKNSVVAMACNQLIELFHLHGYKFKSAILLNRFNARKYCRKCERKCEIIYCNGSFIYGLIFSRISRKSSIS